MPKSHGSESNLRAFDRLSASEQEKMRQFEKWCLESAEERKAAEHMPEGNEKREAQEKWYESESGLSRRLTEWLRGGDVTFSPGDLDRADSIRKDRASLREQAWEELNKTE